MRVVIFSFICVCAVMCQDVSQMSGMPKYDERYDYLDVDAIFTNKRLIRNYVDCLINSHRCTPEGKQLKRLLPEALRTKCVRCTERQKRTAVKIINRLKHEYPDEWAKLATRWDPTGDFTRYFEEYLAKESFNSIPGSGNVLPLTSNAQPPPPPPPPRPSPSPDPEPTSTTTAAPMTSPPLMSTPPKPMILNRFGGEGELMMGSPSSAVGTTKPTVMPTMKVPTMKIPTLRPITPKPTPITWSGMPTNTFPTRFPPRPTSDIPPPFSTAITIIDQIGYKIIRTTELVTDLLRNTVRAVVG